MRVGKLKLEQHSRTIRGLSMARHDEGAAYIALLRACARSKDLHRGIQAHHDLMRRGLLEKCSDTLVSMYAKCGALAKAQELLDTSKSRSLFSWTALISGYAQRGQGQDALDCFQQMQHVGLLPDAVTFASVLKACGSMRASDKGEQIHNEIARQGLLGTDIILGNALVDMYAKCGAVEKAQQVLEKLPVRDLVSWSALIGGYVQQDQPEKAFECFRKMQREGLSPDAVTFVCILKACGSIGAVDKGKQIHDEIARQGLLGKNVVLGNALVDMYAKCGAFKKAQRVLEELPVANVVSWNALIAGYTQQDQAEQALACFERMQQKGVSPNAVTFVCILKACGSIGAIDKGHRIHDEITRQGLLATNIVLGNAVVDMYSKCGALSKAAQALEDLPVRDVVSWSALIAGYAQQGQGEQALKCYERMQREGLSPNLVTFLSILKACGSIGNSKEGEQIHHEIARQGLAKDVVVGTSLVDMYAKCGALGKAQQVLEELPVQNVVSWNALIVGYVQQGQAEKALNCFEWMQLEGLSPDSTTFGSILKACGSIGAVKIGEQVHQEVSRQSLLGKDVVLGNTLVDMYARCGALETAQQVLEELPVRDVVSWSTLIQGYAQQGQGEQAIYCFEQMQRDGLCPNEVTYLCILKACGSIGAVDKGEQIHEEISKQGLLENNFVLGTALVDMYAKCGAVAKARRVLEKLPVRTVVSWTALLTGYAQLGQAEQAVSCFEGMRREGLSPDAVTYVCILKACGSIGALEKGEQIHDEILRQGLLKREVLLGNSLVDMYAKCGALEKAQQVLEGLPARDVVTWSALVAGYSHQGQADQALSCFEQMQREGHSPDAATFTSILKACGSIGAVGQGQQIHNEITRRGLLGDNVVLGSALLDMYVKCGALEKAQRVHEELSIQNATSWNALIAGYAKQGKVELALSCLKQMLGAGISPDESTMVSILKACDVSGSAETAQSSFADISTDYSIKPDLMHYSSMVDVFGRVGHLDKAIGVIQKMPFSENLLTLWLALLCACHKWGDVNVGRWAFEQAVQVDKSYGATYVLMGNIYAAAGMDEEAEKIAAMRVENKAGIY